MAFKILAREVIKRRSLTQNILLDEGFFLQVHVVQQQTRMMVSSRVKSGKRTWKTKKLFGNVKNRGYYLKVHLSHSTTGLERKVFEIPLTDVYEVPVGLWMELILGSTDPLISRNYAEIETMLYELQFQHNERNRRNHEY